MDISRIEYKELLRKFKNLSQPEDRVKAYDYVRDIQYGDIGSRNPIDVLIKNRGTCSGKHSLLKALLESLGYEVNSYFSKHDFKNFPIKDWPDELIHFRSKTLTDFHDFLKVKVGDKWIILDAMFDQDLAPLGFLVQTWDGFSDLEILVSSEDIFPAETDMEAHKIRLISELPKQVQLDRRDFLVQLTKWIDGCRGIG